MSSFESRKVRKRSRDTEGRFLPGTTAKVRKTTPRYVDDDEPINLGRQAMLEYADAHPWEFEYTPAVRADDTAMTDRHRRASAPPISPGRLADLDARQTQTRPSQVRPGQAQSARARATQLQPAQPQLAQPRLTQARPAQAQLTRSPSAELRRAQAQLTRSPSAESRRVQARPAQGQLARPRSTQARPAQTHVARAQPTQPRPLQAQPAQGNAFASAQGYHDPGLPKAELDAHRRAIEEYKESVRYYAPDENRSAMLREYFQQNPITDTEATLQAYYQKYEQDTKPVDYGDNTDDQLLMCVCLKPDDGRPYIECDNSTECMKQFFHPGCLGFTIFNFPTEKEEWYCPDCMREGLGGAAEYKKRLARLEGKPRTVVRRASTGCVVDQMQGLSVTGAPAVELKPWSADLDKKFASNPDNIRDLNIETLESAKAALRARAAQPLGQPVSKGPDVIQGTVVRQPNKNTWSKEEDKALIECMKEAVSEGLNGNPLWDALVVKLKARGIERKIGGARNRWMRGLREATQIDERRKKNAFKLTTSVQLHKDLRDPNSPRAKNKRYKMSRKYNDPVGTLAAGSSPLRQPAMISTSLSAPAPPRLLLEPRGNIIASSPPRSRRRRATYDEDVDMEDYEDDAGAITDEDDIKDRITRKRPRNE